MHDSSPGLEGLQRALDAAGGTTALTTALGCLKSVVGNWRRKGGIPASQVPAVSRVTGLSPAVLRPDLFTDAASPGFADAQAPYRAEAAKLGLDPEAIATAALRKAIGDEKARRWAEENREAIAAHTRYIEEHDTPLAEYRMF